MMSTVTSTDTSMERFSSATVCGSPCCLRWAIKRAVSELVVTANITMPETTNDIATVLANDTQNEWTTASPRRR